MITSTRDFTTKFNTNGQINLDVSGWDYIIVQVVTPTGTVTFNTTNDGGEITGAVDSNPLSATNWVACLGKNLTTGATATTTAASIMLQFSYIGRFFQAISTNQTVAKIIVTLSKIN